MVILIGGQSHTGKTYLAQRLLEKYKITYLSLDHLKMGLCRGLDEDFYSPVQDYNALGEKLWPIVRGIIMTNIENGQNIIIEGCYILPYLINDFPESYLSEIAAVFIGFSPDYIKKYYENIIKKHSRAMEKRGEVLGEPMDAYIKQNGAIKAECENHCCAYFEIEDDYLEETETIIEYIGRKLK